jgi:hypothetical protein
MTLRDGKIWREVDYFGERHLTAAALVLVLLASCASPSPQPSSTSGSAAPSTTPIPTPTAVPTPSPTPEPAGRLETVRQLILAWKSSTIFTSFQVVVEVRNTGTAWVRQTPLQSDYTIRNPDGGVTLSGTFPYAYPEYIGPGETGYLIEDSLTDGVTVADFATVHVSDRYVQAPADTFATYVVDKIAWRSHSFTDGLTAKGVITLTPGARDISNAAVAVLCLGADGAPLGVTTTYLVQNLTAGVAKDFRTMTESPPLRPSQCVTTVGYAEARSP